MSRDGDGKSVERERLRHAIADVVRAHVFHSSRPWPDGSQPVGPDWNPGCSCGKSLYYFEHDLHVADELIAARTLLPAAANRKGVPE